jgi:hypothetical protein
MNVAKYAIPQEHITFTIFSRTTNDLFDKNTKVWTNIIGERNKLSNKA